MFAVENERLSRGSLSFYLGYYASKVYFPFYGELLDGEFTKDKKNI